MLRTTEKRTSDLIGDLTHYAEKLIEQRKKVRRDKILKDGYTLAIAQVVDAIERQAAELMVEEEKEK